MPPLPFHPLDPVDPFDPFDPPVLLTILTPATIDEKTGNAKYPAHCCIFNIQERP
jgi:hypothetical protein